MPERYTYARAYRHEGDARAAWQAVRVALGPGAQNVSVFRCVLPALPGAAVTAVTETTQVVALVGDADLPAASRRRLERLLVAAEGGAPYVLDAGVADTLHARRAQGRRLGVPRLDIERPDVAHGLPLPYRTRGMPEPPDRQ